KPTLTLSGGLRYDYIPQASIIGPGDRPLNAIDLFHQQWQVGMAASAINACTTPFVNPCVPGGFASSNPNFNGTVPLSGQTYSTFDNIVFKGSAASAQSITDNWGPRVGIAWQFLPNTVLRFRSEEHTSELQSRGHLVCRVLLEKKKKTIMVVIVQKRWYSSAVPLLQG